MCHSGYIPSRGWCESSRHEARVDGAQGLLAAGLVLQNGQRELHQNQRLVLQHTLEQWSRAEQLVYSSFSRFS